VWILRQVWHDLLFAHWPIAPEALRPLVPARLALDSFEGRAWVGVVPFRMSGIRLRGLPPLPGCSAFCELNLRTYIAGERPGVYFFSLDAASPLAVFAARRFFHLSYYRARISQDSLGDELRYGSRRTHAGAPAAEFRGRYRPDGPAMASSPGSLEHWLTERYSLYTVDSQGRAWRGDVEHAPWPLQPARATIEANSMAAAAGIALPDQAPLLHFARRLEVRIGTLEAV
jgi:uncharacterized protein YqjF (DUF2071 family)